MRMAAATRRGRIGQIAGSEGVGIVERIARVRSNEACAWLGLVLAGVAPIPAFFPRGELGHRHPWNKSEGRQVRG